MKFSTIGLIIGLFAGLVFTGRADPIPGSSSATKGEPVTAQLAYSEAPAGGDTQPGTTGPAAPPVGGGNLTAVVEDLAQHMNAKGGGGGTGTQEKKTTGGKASLAVTLRAILDQTGGFRKVTAEVSDPQWRLDSDLSPEATLGCNADHDHVMSALASWSVILSPAQARELISKGFVMVPVTGPFSDLQYLSGAPVALKVTKATLHIAPFALKDRALDDQRQALEAPLDQVNTAINLLQPRIDADVTRLQVLVQESDQRQAQLKALTPKLQPIYQQMQAIVDDSTQHPHYDVDSGEKTTALDKDHQRDLRDQLYKLAPFQVQWDRLAKAEDAGQQQMQALAAEIAAFNDRLTALKQKRNSLEEDMLTAMLNPYLTQVTVTADGEAVFRQEYQRASADRVRQFESLVRDLKDAQAALDQAAKIHDSAKQDFLTHAKEASRLLGAVANLIMPTFYKQAVVESAANAVDLAQAYMTKGGMAGVFAEFFGKLAEGGVKLATDAYGPDFFPSGGEQVQTMSDMVSADLTDPTSAGQVGKTLVTDGVQELVTSPWKDRMAFRMRATANKLTQRIPVTAQLRPDRIAQMKGLGVTLAKEAVKTAFQKYFAQQEIDAWQAYFAEEIQARLLFPYYQASQTDFQNARDWRDQAQAAIDAFQKNTPDPNSNNIWKTTVDREFAAHAGLVVTIETARALPAGFELSAQIAGQPAAGGGKTFSGQAPDDATGGVAVSVSADKK